MALDLAGFATIRIPMKFMQAFSSLFVGARASATQEAEAGRAALVDNCTVLVIDDDSAFLQVLRANLSEAGFTVLSTSSGPKGLNMLQYAPRDIRLVILDYAMPGFDGERTLQYVRQLNPQVKIVGISGYEPEFLPSSFRQGVDKLIQKPFPQAELVDSLVALLEEQTLKPAANDR